MTQIQEQPPTLNTAGREGFRAAHDTPRIDLAADDWIPIVRLDGSRDQVGVAEILTAAHEIEDIAEPDPLARAAMRRYLSALAARVVALTGSAHQATWVRRVDKATGFDGDEVAAVLADQATHLYLFHPSSPFMQDRRFLDDAAAFDKNWLTSSDELLTPLPGATSRAWAYKPGDLGVAAGLEWDAAARALVTRWYYGLSGNGGGGDMGGAFPNGTSNAPMTHVFRIDPRGLFGTLLRNLPRDIVAGQRTPVDGPAWMDRRRPRPGGDGLYRYSTTATAALLAAPDDGGRIRAVLRGSIDDPPGSKESRKAAKDAARDFDPHRIQRIPGSNGKPVSDVRISASEPPLRRLAVLRRGVIAEGTMSATGVVNEATLWLAGAARRHDETLELTLANLAGSATSPQWAAATTVTMPAAHLDPLWTNAGDLDTLIDVGFGDHGVHRAIRSAILSVFRGQEDAKHSVVGAALASSARLQWLWDAELITDRALAGSATLEEAQLSLWRAGRDAVSAALSPYASTTRYAGRVVQAVSSVRSRT